MPTIKGMKLKSGNKYPVSYRVVGSLADLTREQLEELALRQLRASARSQVQQELTKAEPAIVTNKRLLDGLIANNMGSPETARDFIIKTMGGVLEMPSQFEIPLSDLLPGESSRGRKAADLFSLTEEEEEDTSEEIETAE